MLSMLAICILFFGHPYSLIPPEHGSLEMRALSSVGHGSDGVHGRAKVAGRSKEHRERGMEIRMLRDLIFRL